ncbi:Bacteriohemerythrin [bioreactor metagenome]|uniref:Bacteriohemerythrin n=1 Tax=bioreactor metagenome TaxID=1076179 RepID=A0A644UDN9_9ZZZZ|nr:bacteriohemerythrin [Negativicutes bacterium]
MFDWKPEYSVGIAAIDTQHKRLFELVGQLHEIARTNDGFDHYDEIVKVFNELRDYTVYHFGYEEKLFEQYNYDSHETKIHKLEHGGFVNKMIKIGQEDLDKNEKKILLNVIMFAVDWIEKHILHTDKKYSDFLNSHGVR